MAGLYPDEAEYKEYWTGQKLRSQTRANRSINPVFTNARDRITDNLLEATNNRRYLKETDPRKQMRMIKRDPKIEQVDRIIEAAGVASLTAIYANQREHYQEEVAPVTKNLYPWISQIGDTESKDLTPSQLNALYLTPFLGKTYKQWISGNTADAKRQWDSKFRAVMGGTLTGGTKETQLIKELRGVLRTQESRNKIVANNSMIVASRLSQKNVAEGVWPVEDQPKSPVQFDTESLNSDFEDFVTLPKVAAVSPSATLLLHRQLTKPTHVRFLNPDDSKTTEHICRPLINKVWKIGSPDIRTPSLHFECRSSLSEFRP